MINELKLALEDTASTVYEFLLLPGHVLLSTLSFRFPGVSRLIGIEGETGSAVQVLVASIIAWIVLGLVGLLAARLFQDLLRDVAAIVRTLLHRAAEGLANLKTALVCRLRDGFGRRDLQGMRIEPIVDFDDVDIAILLEIAKRGPGFTLAAPELAETFRCRPSQVQPSLDKLLQARLLDSAIGSTDGYDNFRLTNAGIEYVAMWERQQANA